MPKKTEVMTQPEAVESAPAQRDYSVRRWMIPNKRAKGYAEERKAKVHQRGAKEGQELHAADGQVVRRGGRVGVGILADGDVIRGRREV